MGILGHVMISHDTMNLLDREDLDAALFEHGGFYFPSFWEWLTIPILGDFEYDDHCTRHEDRNGTFFSILTVERDPIDRGRATYIFQDHETPLRRR